jgi:hypothetical protein
MTILVLGIGYLVYIFLVTALLSQILKWFNKKYGSGSLDPREASLGRLIGTMEGLTIITLVLLGEYTALSLIMTAKTISRSKSIEQNPAFYLFGTLLNLLISILYGVLLGRVALVLLMS